jgi:hypothetical protein
MIFVLCEGNAANRESVMKLTYPEAVLWLQFKKYESWLMEQK